MASSDATYGAQRYRGRRVLVLGLARSGEAALALLRGAGAEATGADEKPANGHASAAPARVVRGAFTAALLDGVEEIVLSPGIPTDHAIVREALSRGIPVTGELELGARFARAPMIAVTGTNGKSTTVTLIGEILAEAGRKAVVCGNVGLPFTAVARDLGPDGVYVLEVSSFQLETVTEFHPRVAGILNLTPDHLDRYRDVEDYYRMKERIIERCGREDTFFFNANDERCARIGASFGGRRIPFSSSGRVAGGAYLDGALLVRELRGAREEIMERRELGIVGLHNVENALAAIAAVDPYDAPADACRRALARFTGLPHRMEKVATIAGVDYYNDSKGTNVEATMVTLRGLDRPTVLIAGGKDKGGDFTKLRGALGAVRAIVTIGQAAPLIEEALAGAVPIERAASMRDAVERSFRLAKGGDLVLLSPACASFDMFRDFEHRGEVFRECVRELQKATR